MSHRIPPIAALVASLLLLCPAAAAQPQPEEIQTEVAEIDALFADIERIRSEYRSLEEEEPQLGGEALAVTAIQMRKQVFEIVRKIDLLVSLVIRQRDAGVQHPRGLKRTRTLLLDMDRTLPVFIDSLQAETAEFRSALANAPKEEREGLAIQIRRIEEILDEVYPFYLRHLQHREELGLEAGVGRRELESRLTGRASMLSGRLELLSQRVDDARQRAEASSGDAALQAAVRAVEEELDIAASSL